MMTNITSALDKAHVYNDLSGLHELRSADGTEAEKVQATAKQFESMMLNLMLKTMRKANAVFAEGNMLNTHSTRFYEDMLDQQLSLNMTREEGLGLADMLAKQLTQDYSKPPPTGHRTLADYPRHSAQLNPAPLSDDSLLSAQETDILANIESLTADLYSDNNVQLFATQPVNYQPGQSSVAGPLPATLLTATATANSTATATGNADENGIYAEHDSLPAATIPAGSALPVTQPAHFSSPREFSETLFPVAQRVASQLGVDPKLLLAQAALETGWGQHMITDQGKPSFNLFGIKADSSWQGEVTRVTTTEYRQGVRLKEQAEFRSYQSYEESFTDYLQFLQSNFRYRSALAKHAEPKAFAQALQTAGYATDPQYANKIFRIYQQMGGNPIADDSGATGPSGIATAKDERG